MPGFTGSLARRLAVGLTISVPLLLAGACATRPTDPVQRAAFDQANDPFEPMNRTIFDFNDKAYRYVLVPIADGYNALPTPARSGVHNVIGNLGEPVVFMNKTLQGNVSDAGTTVARFLVNTIFGFGGLIDVASHNKLPEPRAGDFGATLYTYGVGEGPYLVLPLFGPSNPRDGIGMAVDGVADPWTYVLLYTTYPEQFGVAFGKGIDMLGSKVDDYRDARRTSLDFYAFLRSSYRQNRRFELGQPTGDESLYDVPADKNDHP
jgi:phospholipid-binding lipoprotein MlaA